MTRMRRTGGFAAMGSDGKRYEVIEYTDFIDTTTLHSDQRQEVPGLKSYKLSNGDHVNAPSGKETAWTVVQTGVKLNPIK